MMSRRCVRWIATVAVFGAGCSTLRHYPAPPEQSWGQLVEIDSHLPEPGTTLDRRDVPGPPRAPRNVLVLSGGGMNGAYTAGVLKGWTESGTRPQFDVVTGISTGALIAPYAFLGPEYDTDLERLYTSTRREDIYRPRLLWWDSIASSEPLEQRIAACATPSVLQKIAEAHRQGRRLYVGTSNLDTKRLVVWDLGAIAASDPALFRKVLLASCSVPGLLPPVAIDVVIAGKRFTELHVDGGVNASVFLQPDMVGIRRSAEVPSEAAGPSVYVIVAGTLYPKAATTERKLFSIYSASVDAAFHTRLEGDLTRLFLLTRCAKGDFRLAGLGEDQSTASNSMSFDPGTMQGLFDEGVRTGRDSTAWRSMPPGIEDGDLVPRSTTRFAAIRRLPAAQSWTPEKITVTLGGGHPITSSSGGATDSNE